ncbi:MAG TPA: hypothetical protein VJY62_00340, partial [Bacteroidia bacterium]|nr:hypothetical protein [Bacteroidia bacterium]
MKAQKHLHPESFMLVLVSVFLFLNIKASCQGEAYDQFAEIKAKKEQIPVWISELKKGHYIENLFFNEDVSLGLMDSLISRGQDNTHSIIKVPLLFRECVFESILDFSPESEKNIF